LCKLHWRDEVQALLQHFGEDVWLEELRLETGDLLRMQALEEHDTTSDNVLLLAEATPTQPNQLAGGSAFDMSSFTKIHSRRTKSLGLVSAARN